MFKVAAVKGVNLKTILSWVAKFGFLLGGSPFRNVLVGSENPWSTQLNRRDYSLRCSL